MKLKLLLLTIVGLAVLLTPSVSLAAQFYSGQTLSYDSPTTLQDAYIAGNMVKVSTTVTNDLVVAGSQVEISGKVEEGLMAAAGNLTINGDIGGTARVAGGTVVLNGSVGRDLIVMGGTVTIAKEAIIDGDLVVLSGAVTTVDGTVKGKVIVKGDQLTINGTIGSLANTQVNSLTVGSSAVVNGNLSYQAKQPGSIDNGAVIKGRIDFQQRTSTEGGLFSSPTVSTYVFFYRLMANLIFGFVLLYLARKVINGSVDLLKKQVWQTAGWGLGALFLLPIAFVLSMVLSIWLGVAGLVLYTLCLIVAFCLGQIILGWWLMQWWFGRTKEEYQLDGRAVLVGVAAGTVLSLVPVVWWFVGSVVVVLALGTLSQQIFSLRKG